MRVLRQAIHRAIAPPVLVAPAEACVLPLSPFTSVHLRTRDLNVVSFWVAILLQWGHWCLLSPNGGGAPLPQGALCMFTKDKILALKAMVRRQCTASMFVCRLNGAGWGSLCLTGA